MIITSRIIFGMFLCGAQFLIILTPCMTQENSNLSDVSSQEEAGDRIPLNDEEDITQKAEKFKLSHKGLTIRVVNMPLAEFLEFVSKNTNALFSFSGEDIAKKRVTLFIKDATLDEILEILTKVKDIEFQRIDSTSNFVIKKSTTVPPDFPPLTKKDFDDPVLKGKISLKFKEAPVFVFLESISEQARINFLVGDGVENIRITASFDKVTVADILQFLKTMGLSYSRIKNRDLFIIRRAAGFTRQYSKAENEFKDKNYEEAVKLYKELADKYPDSEMADYALLMVAVNYDWIAARDNDATALKKEEESLQRLIKNYPGSMRLGDAYLYLGQIYSGHGGVKTKAVDCKKAVEFYKLAIKNTYRDWVRAQAEVRIGQCHEMQGDKDKAMSIYKEVIKKYPNTDIAEEVGARIQGPGALLEIGFELEKLKEYSLAIAVYNRISERNDSDHAVRKALLRTGVCQSFMDENEKAVKTFEEYLARYMPGADDNYIYLYLGKALEKLGRKEESQKYLKQSKIMVRPRKK